MAAVIDHLWQSTLVFLVAALVAFVLRANGAHVRYWIWFAASVKFLVPFSALLLLGGLLGGLLGWHPAAMPMADADWALRAAGFARPMAALSSANEPAPATAAAGRLGDRTGAVEEITADEIGAEDEIGSAAEIGSAGEIGTAVESTALAIWIAGSLVVLAVWLVRWVRLRRLVRSAEPWPVDPATVRSMPVLETSSVLEPGLFGVLRPVLILPKGITTRLDAAQLDAVLAHEMCHLRRRDNLTAMVHMIVETLFWFHPLVWWIGARLLEERERACDEAVLASGVDSRVYAEGILEVCRCYVESPLPCAAGAGFGGGSLRDRVERIVEDRGFRSFGWRGRAMLCGTAAVVLGAPIGLGLLATPRAVAQPAGEELEIASVSIVEMHHAATMGGWRIDSWGALTAHNRSLRELIAWAYGIEVPLVAGPPELDSPRYKITVETARVPPRTAERGARYQRMMRDLLALRFGVEVRWETRTVPIFELRTDPRALPMLPAVPGEPGPLYRLAGAKLTVSNAPIDGFTSWLTRMLGRPVLDRTGLTERYSFELVWGTSASWSTSLFPPTRDALTYALESQLGLLLTSDEAPVRFVVVDRVVPPDLSIAE